jgi:hypothetical protein
VLDIWKHPYSTYPPSSADSICAAAKPTISSSNKYSDSTLTGWTTALSAGDTLLVNLQSSSVFTAITLFLILMPVGSTPADGFTDERCRDVIGAALLDSSTVDFTYDDSADTITASVLTAGLSNFSSSVKGVVPASGGGTTNYLRADGSWAAPPGSSLDGVAFTPVFVSGTNVTNTTNFVAIYIEYPTYVEMYFGFHVAATATATDTQVIFTVPKPALDNAIANSQGFATAAAASNGVAACLGGILDVGGGVYRANVSFKSLSNTPAEHVVRGSMIYKKA